MDAFDLRAIELAKKAGIVGLAALVGGPVLAGPIVGYMVGKRLLIGGHRAATGAKRAVGKRLAAHAQATRDRQAREQAERARREAEKSKPEPKSKQQLYRELQAEMDAEIAAALPFGQDEEERAAIREIVRAKYIDRLAEIE